MIWCYYKQDSWIIIFNRAYAMPQQIDLYNISSYAPFYIRDERRIILVITWDLWHHNNDNWAFTVIVSAQLTYVLTKVLIECR